MIKPLSIVPPSNADPEVLALLRAESDAGLLKLMAERGRQGEWADDAFREFYGRHQDYLWNVCLKIAVALRGEAWVEDMYSDTFTRAYLDAAKFKLPAGLSGDREVRAVRAWLGKIATNILKGILRNRRQEYTQDDESWVKILNESPGPEEHIQGAANDKLLPLIQAGLATLSDREQHVIRTTFLYYRVGERFQRLPNKITRELAENLGTTPENLRKIRERALKKLKDYVEQNLNIQEMPTSNEKQG